MTSDEKTCLKQDFSPSEGGTSGEPQELDINEALEGASFGFGTLLYCVGPFLLFCLEGAEIIVLSIVGLMVKCEWELSAGWVSALQMVVLVGMMLGSLFGSPAGDRFGRKPVCLVCSVGLSVTGLLSGFVTTFWQLFLLRGLVGFFAGVAGGPALALSGEVPPARYRAAGLSCIALAWGVGASITSGLAYFVVEPYGWRGLLIAAALAFAPSIPCFILIGESPRYDVTRGRFESAQRTLRTLYRLNRQPKSDIKLKRDHVTSAPEEGTSIFKTLCETGSVWNLALICAMGGCAVFGYYAIAYSIPRFLNEGYCSGVVVSTTESCTFDKSVLFDLGVVSLSEPLGVLIAVITVDIIGRRRTFFAAQAMFLVAVTALYFCVGYAYLMVWITAARMTIAAICWSPYIITAEYFPTRVRSCAIALFFCCSRVAGMVGIWVAQVTYSASPRLLLGVVQVAVVLCAACLGMLKRETMGAEIQ